MDRVAAPGSPGTWSPGAWSPGAWSPEAWGSRPLRRTAAVAGLAFAAMTVAMARWEQPLRVSGGRGILDLEFAASAPTAANVCERWGPAGRRTARWETWADFAYQPSYAVLGCCLAELARRRAPAGSAGAIGWRRTGRTARYLPLVACGCDAVEGVGMLDTLRRVDRGERPVAPVAALTRAAATTKFALLGASTMWSAAAWVAGTAGRSPGGVGAG